MRLATASSVGIGMVSFNADMPVEADGTRVFEPLSRY